MEASPNDCETQTDKGKDPRTGKFLPGHRPYIVKGNANGLRGRPGKDETQAWEWARRQKAEVIRALVYKAIKGHHPSIELYLAYVDGRPVETFRTTSLNMNVSAEDIKELSEKIEANRQAFEKELGIGATQTLVSGAVNMSVVEKVADATRTPETKSS